jgi:hypothetical protein
VNSSGSRQEPARIDRLFWESIHGVGSIRAQLAINFSCGSPAQFTGNWGLRHGCDDKPARHQEQQSGTVINAAAAMRSQTDRDLNNWNFPEPGERL